MKKSTPEGAQSSSDEEAAVAATGGAGSSSLESDQVISAPPSHLMNPNIPAAMRYGVPAYFLIAFALLLASDVGSGVAAYNKLINPDDPGQDRSKMILQASIFTSIPKLWGTGSYVLTVVIVIASVSWPFVKILLSLYAWCVPFAGAPRRRERLLEVIDALGKWSFVDVVVFSIIVVAFHSTIYLGGPYVEIYIVPRWGLIGFVTANMLILVRSAEVADSTCLLNLCPGC
jgi:hypothetical protein